MNLQDKFPYSSTIVGLNDQYIAYENSAYVNHDSIDLLGKIVHKDAYYTLIERIGNETLSSPIQVKEVFFSDGYVYLLFVDKRNLKVGLRNLNYTIGLQKVEWKITEEVWLIWLCSHCSNDTA